MSHVAFSSIEEIEDVLGKSKRSLNMAVCQNFLNSDFPEHLLNQKA